MDRLARYQAQLQYTQTEEEQGAEIHRGRQFDGLDVVPSVKESIAPMEPNRSGHTAWTLVDRARESIYSNVADPCDVWCRLEVRVMPPP